MKKLVLMVAIIAAFVSCGNKKDSTANTGMNNDSTAQVVVADTTVIIDLTGNWEAPAPTEGAAKATPAPKMNLKADKTAEVTNVPTTPTEVKAAATKDAKTAAKATPVQATWKQNPATPENSGNGTLVLFSSIPGKHNTDSVSYQIINVTDSSLTIQGEAGIFKFKKH